MGRLVRASSKRTSRVLWALLFLFILRVFGQLTVLIAAPSFLPPMDEWFSGLIPYAYLLTSQILIICLMSVMSLQVQLEKRFWGSPKRPLGEFLVSFGAVYLAVMIIRYLIRMSLYPLERWTGGAIPIFFHWVLAAFVITLGLYHLRRTPTRNFSRFAWSWRISAWSLTCLGIISWTSFQLAPTFLALAVDARAAQYAVRVERSVSLMSRDGTKLVADIFHPQRIAKTPTILVRIPYSKVLLNTLFSNVVGRYWAERGYTAVIQGTRGRYESSGCYEPLIHEEADGRDTLNWLANQPWFNGKVGMWGGSYFGYTQLVIADARDPKISAFIIQLSSADFSEMFYSGGAFALESALQWGLGSYGKIDRSLDPNTIAAAASSIPLLSADEKGVGAQVGFIRDWMREKPGADYWRRIDATSKIAEIQGPVMSMAGWFDPFLSAQLRDFKRIRETSEPSLVRQSKLIVGPWAHARAVQLPDGYLPRHYRIESLAPTLEWFDHHLQEKAPKTESAPVRLFVMGRNEWRDETEWPLTRAVAARLFLNQLKAGRIGELTKTAKVGTDSDRYTYDPAHPFPTVGGAMIGPNAGTFAQPAHVDRSDVLTYETELLAEDIEVTGEPTVNLTVSTSAPNTDFVARVLDVKPDGAAYNITDGVLRRSFAPHEKTRIQIALWPTSYLFKRGHRIRLEVTSSNFPHYDRNLNISETRPDSTESQTAEQQVFYGNSAESYLFLPVIPESKQ
jgi:putative CocE/NonD family hydrolase